MKFKALIAAIALTGMAVTPLARATTVQLTFSYTDTAYDVVPHNVEVIGELTASDNLDGSYTLTGGVLHVTGGLSIINGDYALVPNPLAPGIGEVPNVFFFDNQLFPSSNPLLDGAGLLGLANSGTYLNIWGNSPDNYSLWTRTSGGVDVYQFEGPASARVAFPVPDGGATALLLGVAVTGLGIVRRKLL